MKRTKRRLTFVVFLACATSSAAAQNARRTAADCEKLRSLSLEHTTIALAEEVSSTFSPPGTRDTIRDLPSFCRVVGAIMPTSDSHIAFEVWLPLEQWNGKFAGVGNGGWAGNISYSGPPIYTLAEQVRRGYAVASTNTGHEGNGGDARFAYGHPERLIDFGWRSVHEMTVKAKAVTQSFYRRPPQRAYWLGCSTGGKQALTEAQRFPEDYDGIVAGAPASNWIPLMTSTLLLNVWAIGDSTRFLPPPSRRLARAAVMKACDALDGLADGLLDDPRRCGFDPASLLCPTATADSTCLTAGQISALKGIYGGAVDPTTGRQLAPGHSRGSETFWGPFTTPGRPFLIPVSFFQWLVFGDSAWDWRSFDLSNPATRQAWEAASARYAPILSAIDPDLRKFRERGGKLIEYHGWNDQLITPGFSVDYYDSVIAFESVGRDRAAAMSEVQGWYRLFMVPGMAHCAGGNGPSVFDMEHALENWVERGIAPDEVRAEQIGPNGVPTRSRPLCPYPKVAVYKGEGDVNDAANFACRDSRPQR